MKSSSINHPENEPLIIIRQWQLDFCEGDKVAAALMSFFEYWHNIKLGNASQNEKANVISMAHGDDPAADTSLFQWHTESELITGIMNIAKAGKTLSRGLELLESRGIITIHTNPNPRYKFDKTRHFLFHPEIANEWLNSIYRQRKNTLSSSKNTSRSGNFTLRSGKNPSAIPEITTEITTEILENSENSPKTEQEHKGDLNDLADQISVICKIDVDTASIVCRDALKKVTISLNRKPDIAQKLTKFSEWWYANDWRGKRGQSPTAGQVGDTWGQFEEGMTQPDTSTQITDEQMEAVAYYDSLKEWPPPQPK